MIKIGYPKKFARVKPYFPEKEKEKDLYIVAEETTSQTILAIIRFYYDDQRLFIHEVQMPYREKDYLAIFDGIVRTLLFRLAEEGYQKISVRTSEKAFDDYFLGHGFGLTKDRLSHDAFPAEFFKPCEGCREE